MRLANGAVKHHQQAKKKHHDANFINAMHHLEVKIARFMGTIWFENLNEISEYLFHDVKTI